MHRARSLFLFFLLIPPCSAFLITEFCPDPYLADDADEYIILSGSGLLDGITITDGRGGFRFPPGTIAGGTVTIARNAVAFNESHGYLPDFEWMDYSPAVSNAISGDILRLANTRDELVLYEQGRPVQRVAWPGDVKCREGQVHFLENGVWDRRPLFLGQSRFGPKTFDNVTVTAFVSPDSAGEVFSSALASARQSVHVNVYEFSSMDVASLLIKAKERGSDVLVLVEGGPVGGISAGEKNVVWNLNRSGIPVFQMAPAGGIKAPYRFDHAKYAIIDGQSVILTNENFKSSGIPTAGLKGNRGWGMFLEDPDLAAYFDQVFLSDVRMKNSIPLQGGPGAADPVTPAPYDMEFPAQRFYGVTVVPVLSPDTSYQIADLINSARESIQIEQAYITNESALVLNPYLEAAINASRRGVQVRVLLDSYWYNTEEEKDNDEMVATINRIAAAEHLPLEARCAELGLNNIEKIHNKGVIVDNSSVLISSINWNSNSPNFNREAGIIVQHTGVARYFRAVFEDDWQPLARHRRKDPDTFRYLLVIPVICMLLVIYRMKRR